MERPTRPPPRRGRRLAAGAAGPLAAVALAALAPEADAAPKAPLLAACAPAPDDAPVSPKAVSAEGDVTLADGRVLRLAGLDLPRAPPATPDLAQGAGAALLAWAAGPVALHPLGPADRWGRIPALLFRAAPPGEAGAALLGAGLARAAPEPAVHPCAAARLTAEEGARAAGRGLWAAPVFAVLRPGDAEGLRAQAGGLALVEGILHVHESRGALYLALARGRRGFAAVVSRRDGKAFAKAGLELRDYEGTPVRLRGDLDARFGPRMRLTDSDAVESLEPGSIVEEPSTARPRAGGDAEP